MDFLNDIVGANGAAQLLQATPRSYNNPDDALLVKFFWQAVPNKTKSDIAGREVNDQVEFIEIIAVGGDTIHRKAKAEDRTRFIRQYNAFLLGNHKPEEGTLLETWPVLNVAQVADLKAQKVFTVEQLAALHDGQLETLGMGSRALRQKARDFIDAAAGMAPLAKLREQYEQLRVDHELLKDEFRKKFGQEPVMNREVVQKIMTETKHLQEPITETSQEVEKKKRGRPRKVITELL